MFTEITTHKEDAKKRLLEQYKKKPLIAAMLDAFNGPIQEIESLLVDLNTLRDLDTAFGQTLDNLGTIIGLERPSGATDDEYRILLKTKVSENISNGEPERIIGVFKVLVAVDLVHFQDGALASYQLQSSHVFPDQDAVNMLIAQIERIGPAGTRLDAIVTFDEFEAFAFDGLLPGFGFGSTVDMGAGGKLAYLNRARFDFAFFGPDPKTKGFGSTKDPLVGGSLA